MIVFDVDRIGPWVSERTGGTYYPGSGQAIGLERDGVLYGGVLYDQSYERSVCMHCAGDSAYWLNKTFLRMSFDYPFNQLKVGKVIALVDSANTAAIRFDQKLGFIEEGRLKDAGRQGDLVLLTMTRSQCRWIGDTHGQK